MGEEEKGSGLWIIHLTSMWDDMSCEGANTHTVILTTTKIYTIPYNGNDKIITGPIIVRFQ